MLKTVQCTAVWQQWLVAGWLGLSVTVRVKVRARVKGKGQDGVFSLLFFFFYVFFKSDISVYMS